MFRGHFEHTIDEKGRLSIPVRFREALAGLQDECLVLTKFRLGSQRCLDVYSLSAWRSFEKDMKRRGRFEPRLAQFRRAYVSGAHESPLDAQGRVLIPPALRRYAGLARDVTCTGEIDFFRVWDRGAWDAQFEQDEKIFDDTDFLSSLGL